MAASKSSNFKLPLSIITIIDVARVSREVSGIDDFMVESAAKAASQRPSLPRMSRNLEELTNQNGFNLLVEDDRKALRDLLSDLRRSAPVMHISFASDPPANFLIRLITWLRAEIDPQLVLKIGLQPTIAAGCVLRTNNKYFDFSLRQHIEDKADVLMQQIKAVSATT